MSRIQKDLESINKIKEELKSFLINEVEKIDQNGDIKPIGSNCFTVNFSTLSTSKGFVLSPFYYDFEQQKKRVIERIEHATDAGINYINSVIETGKDKSTGEPFNPKFIEQLKVIVEK